MRMLTIVTKIVILESAVAGMRIMMSMAIVMVNDEDGDKDDGSWARDRVNGLMIRVKMNARLGARIGLVGLAAVGLAF